MKRIPVAVGTALLAGSVMTAPASAELTSPLVCAPFTSQPFVAAQASSTARGAREAATRAIVGESQIPAGREPATSASSRRRSRCTSTCSPRAPRLATGGSPTADPRADRGAQPRVRGWLRGAASGFRFELKEITRTINARWHEMATLQDELEAKRTLRRGDATTLNIYSTNVMLGFAYYPEIVAGGYGGYQDLDGVAIHFGSMPGGYVKDFNLGHTATREVGHWLGLPHTFEQGCEGHGDYIDDTPAVSVPTSGCPAGKDACPEPGLDPIHNYMDYSHDACYTQFTTGQATRMQEQYLHWRVKHGYSPCV